MGEARFSFEATLLILNDIFGKTERWFSQPNGPAEVQCEFFGPISGLNFGR